MWDPFDSLRGGMRSGKVLSQKLAEAVEKFRRWAVDLELIREVNEFSEALACIRRHAIDSYMAHLAEAQRALSLLPVRLIYAQPAGRRRSARAAALSSSYRVVLP